MKNIVIFLDEWINDKNFIYSEIELIKKFFNVTIICNDRDDNKFQSYPANTRILFYRKKWSIKVIGIFIKCFLDKVFWKELCNITNENNKLSKLSEIIRFYINAELFYRYLLDNKLVESDTVYYSYWFFYKCFAITKHRNKIGNSKIITRTHQYDLFNVSIPSGYQPFKYAMDDNLNKIIFIAEQGRQYYLEKYKKKNNDKYLLYHLGTRNYNKLNPYTRTEEVTVVSCSSVIPRKRVEIIAKALSEIDDININWIHFGTGSEFDALRIETNRLLGNKSNIKYILNGYTNHEDIMHYYMNNSVDAFVMVASSEGNPVSVMEAMSFGIPIISFNISNMSNMINQNGILIGKEDTTEVANAIRKLAELPDDIVISMREKSRVLWENNYNEELNNNKFIKEVLLEL